MNLAFPLFPDSASTLAPQVDAIYFFGVAIAIFFSLLIGFVLLYLAVRYRRTPDNQVGAREHAGIWLEITWSVIPLAILMVMFAWGAVVFLRAVRPPSDAIEYFATGKQWMWKFQHPNGHREINQLHVPKGQPIKITMTSEDVIHDLFIPAFRVKQDVVPGRYTTLWFEATKTGVFNLFCAEYCGAEHSYMGGSVVVMEPWDYEQWLNTRGTETGGGGAPMSGADLFAAHTCATCHREDSNLQGPQLRGIFGHEVELADGSTAIVDENYLRESILNPAAKVVKGYNAIMPTYQGQVSEEELVQLILYIKGLTPDEAPDTEAENAS